MKKPTSIGLRAGLSRFSTAPALTLPRFLMFSACWGRGASGGLVELAGLTQESHANTSLASTHVVAHGWWLPVGGGAWQRETKR